LGVSRIANQAALQLWVDPENHLDKVFVFSAKQLLF